MRQKWTGEMVKEFLENEGYQLIKVTNWDYVKTKEKIVVICGKHESYEVRWNNFQQGQRCPKCSNLKNSDNRRFNHQEICEKVKKLDEGYHVCDDSPKYKRNTTKLKLSCGEHEYFASWADFRSGKRCPRCSGVYKYSHEEICEEVSKIHSEYSVCCDSPVYEGAFTKLKLHHSVCENEFDVTWNDFKNGRRPCGCHTFSKNEVFLREYFKSKDIKFSEQVTFDDLKSERKLRYDFGIYENDKISILIEFDGIQHFEPREYFGGQKQFEKQQHHDKLKTDYAEENSIPLFRFTYKDKFEEIENMLNFILDITLTPTLAS